MIDEGGAIAGVELLDPMPDHLLARTIHERFGMPIDQQVLAVLDPLDDDRRRDVIEHELEEFLGLLDFHRQLAPIGHVFKQRHQEFRLAVFIARNHAPRAEDARLCAALDDEFHAGIARRRLDRVFVGLHDGPGRLRREDFFGPMADNLVAWKTAELFERPVGENVLAVVDAFHRDANRNVVDHGFEEALGGGELARELALLAEVLVHRHEAAAGYPSPRNPDLPAVTDIANEGLRNAFASRGLVGIAIEHPPRLPQCQHFRKRHARPDLRTRQAIDFQIAVVAEHHALPQIDHHDAMGQVVQRRGGKLRAAPLPQLEPAVGGIDPEKHRGKERRDDADRAKQLPQRNRVGAMRVEGVSGRSKTRAREGARHETRKLLLALNDPLLHGRHDILAGLGHALSRCTPFNRVNLYPHNRAS